MRIPFNEKQIGFLTATLGEVDKRSYDPVYKNTIDRVVLQELKEGGTVVSKVVLEEMEVYTLIEALNDKLANVEKTLNSKEEKDAEREECENMLSFINENTGLSL